MNDKAKHRGATIAETLVVIGILIALNIAGYYAYKRVDFTENRQFAVSSSTRKVLQKLDDPVTVEVFMSRDLPAQLVKIREAVRDKLQELSVASGGKLRVRYTDPADDEEEKSRATGLGVPEFQVQAIEKEQAIVKKVFFGLVMNYRDNSEAIPQVYDAAGLEYEIASRLVRMKLDKKPKIALFTGPINLNQQQGPTYQGLNQVLGGSEGFYEIVTIDPSKDRKLPDEIQGVVVMGAFNMSDDLKYSIDQFLMNGGNVVLAFDPMMQTGQSTPGGLSDGYPALPTIEPQLEKYGIKVNKKLVVDQGSPAQAQFRTGFMVLVQDYPLWPKIGPANITDEVPAFARIESVVLPWTAPLSDEKRGEAKFTPLFFSTEKAFLLSSPFKLDPQQNWRFLSTTSVEKGPFKLGYLVSGKIPSAYPDGPPAGSAPGAPGLFDESKHVKESTGAGKLVVIPSASAFNDQFLQQYQENALLMANLGDMLAIGDELTDIRSTPVTARPLKSLSSAQKNVVRWALTLGVPLLIVLIGMAVWGARARRRQAIQRQFSGA
jgi:gliding-associated putative ABC transporter substrate-binding component GldG